MNTKYAKLLFLLLPLLFLTSCSQAPSPKTVDQKRNIIIGYGFTEETREWLQCSKNNPCKTYNSGTTKERVTVFDNDIVGIEVFPELSSNLRYIIPENQKEVTDKILNEFYGTNITNWVNNKITEYLSTNYMKSEYYKGSNIDGFTPEINIQYRQQGLSDLILNILIRPSEQIK